MNPRDGMNQQSTMNLQLALDPQQRTRSRQFLLLMCGFALLFGACGPTADETGNRPKPEANASSSKTIETSEIRGLAELLQPGAIVLFGELHGTQEAPAFIANATDMAAQSNLSVRVGVEVPTNMQSRVDGFLLSAGTEDDVKRLTKSSFWSGRDGRSSEALVRLFEKIRQLKHSGKDVDIFLFDVVYLGSGERDVSMAKTILSAIEQKPDAVHLILTGNLHARTGSKDWMGWHIKQRHPQLISLNFAYSSGSAWVHTEKGVGPTKFRGEDQGSVPFVKRFETTDERGFNGYYYVGTISVSPPATLEASE